MDDQELSEEVVCNAVSSVCPVILRGELELFIDIIGCGEWVSRCAEQATMVHG